MTVFLGNEGLSWSKSSLEGISRNEERRDGDSDLRIAKRTDELAALSQLGQCNFLRIPSKFLK